MLVCFDETMSAACFRWTETKKHGLRDGAPGVNSDERRLFSDLRKDLLTGHNDTVIGCRCRYPLCAIKSWQSTCPGELTTGEVEPHLKSGQHRDKHTLSLQLSLKTIYKIYEPWSSNLSTLPPIQGHWDNWLIRVTVLSEPQTKEKQRIFLCFICCTAK